MKKTKKVKYFIDKDGDERTNKCRGMIFKKDIQLIVNLHSQNTSVFQI